MRLPPFVALFPLPAVCSRDESSPDSSTTPRWQATTLIYTICDALRLVRATYIPMKRRKSGCSSTKIDMKNTVLGSGGRLTLPGGSFDGSGRDTHRTVECDYDGSALVFAPSPLARVSTVVCPYYPMSSSVGCLFTGNVRPVNVFGCLMETWN
ncbi:hypothetical protein GGR57DRAFT_108881 [Xylariaceae sp. FL1272]|nr:hypothetical protein GGR57DRAFT_108881 [Xylariaceae sp. FL1272]